MEIHLLKDRKDGFKEEKMTDMIAQVKEAEEKADKLWQERYGEKKTDDGKPKEGDPAPKDDSKPDDKPPEEPKKDEPKPDGFEHKYSVLKGKYDKEVPTMAYQLGEQSKKIAELEGKIVELTKPKEEKKLDTEPPVESEKVKTLKTEYPEVYEGIIEIGKTMVSELKNELEPKINRVDQAVEKAKEEDGKTARERFKANLDGDKEIGKVWRTINQDPDFIDSLQEIEPYSGRTKHELLMDAWNGMDTERTSRFFRDWQKTKPAKKDETKPERKIDNTEVHPAKGTRGPDMENEEKITPTTREELKEFFKDVALGKWKGKDKEAEAEEKRILLGLGVKVK